MLDTVFNLLIFFVIASAFVKESAIDIEKPQAVTASRLKNDYIVIAISPTGEVWYDRNNIGIEGVRSTVAALLLAEERPVVIQADKRATTEVLVRVMDEAKLAGAKTLNLATAVE
jgi:biopolymer transport protein ExbD